ncbi:hypothetical protein ACU686_06935 [Yinghuangia aomiensis]
MDWRRRPPAAAPAARPGTRHRARVRPARPAAGTPRVGPRTGAPAPPAPRRPRRTRPAPHPARPGRPASASAGFARVLTGVLTGRCPLQRLTPHTTHAVRATIAALRDDLRHRAVTGITLAAANATAPTPTTAEGYLRLTLTGPGRDQAIALRLDHTPPAPAPKTPRPGSARRSSTSSRHLRPEPTRQSGSGQGAGRPHDHPRPCRATHPRTTLAPRPDPTRRAPLPRARGVGRPRPGAVGEGPRRPAGHRRRRPPAPARPRHRRTRPSAIPPLQNLTSSYRARLLRRFRPRPPAPPRRPQAHSSHWHPRAPHRSPTPHPITRATNPVGQRLHANQATRPAPGPGKTLLGLGRCRAEHRPTTARIVGPPSCHAVGACAPTPPTASRRQALQDRGSPPTPTRHPAQTSGASLAPHRPHVHVTRAPNHPATTAQSH